MTLMASAEESLKDVTIIDLTLKHEQHLLERIDQKKKFHKIVIWFRASSGLYQINVL